MAYGWIVTRDNATAGLGLHSRSGLTGPRDIPDSIVERLKAGEGVEWRTGDEDGNWSYYGRLIEDDAGEDPYNMSEEAFASPLDNLGRGDAGDAVIQHKNPKTGAWEFVIG